MINSNPIIKYSLFFTIIHASNAVAKLSTLKVLMLEPYADFDGKANSCRLTAYLVTKHAQERNILPDYRINFASFDEAPNGLNQVPTSLAFWQNATTTALEQGTYASPVIVAGQFSTGCKGLGPILHHLGFTAFSVSCSGPFLTNRNLYKNLYLTRPTVLKVVQGQLQFIRTVGHWRRFGILTFVGNPNDVIAADYMYSQALKVNMTVAWYDGINDLNDAPALFNSLKKNDVRILAIWFSQTAMVRQFLCLAHRHAMTGSKYFFVTTVSGLTDLSSLPEEISPGCTKTQLYEQYKYAIGVGPVQIPALRNIKSHFGYDANEFEAIYDNFTNFDRSPDYRYRYQCYDTALSTILTLDDAEKSMTKSGLNISLKSFSERPLEVGKFINDSASRLNFAGLRTGLVKYSALGELSSDYVTLSYWNKRVSTLVGTVRQKPSETGTINDHYVYEPLVETMPWATPNGRSPRDGPDRILQAVKVPQSVFIASVILMATSTLANFGFWIKLCFKLKKLNFEGGLTFLINFALSVAAVLFSLDNVNTAVWHFRIVLIALGVSGHIASLYYGICCLMSTHRHRRNLVASLTLLFINCSILAVWFGYDILQCSVDRSEPHYDANNDAFITYETYKCRSVNDVAWLLSLLVVNVVALGVCSFKLYAHQADEKANHRISIAQSRGSAVVSQAYVQMKREFVVLYLKLIVSITLIVAAALLVLVLRDTISQSILLTFVLSTFFLMSTTVTIYGSLGHVAQPPVNSR